MNFEKLLESGLLDEETTKVLKEALEAKVSERLEESKEALREEFVRRYEHDKRVMVEAADNMFNEHLHKAISELVEEKNSVIAEKIKYKKMVRENAKAIQTFAVTKLREEIAELRGDRKGLAEAMLVFEKFAVGKLTEELKEFHIDKRDLVETKVNLVRTAKSKINETKKEFVRRAAKLVEAKVESTMRKELTDFRKDIKESRKNYFGRRLFEAFEAEFLASHSSDGTKLKEMVDAIKERDVKISEALTLIEEKNQIIEATTAKKSLAENKLVRHKKLIELLGPLPRDKKELMGELLDRVPTSKLDEAYKKNVKYVLNERKAQPNVLKEGKKSNLREETGNKRRIVESVEEIDNVDELRLRKLAGLK